VVGAYLGVMEIIVVAVIAVAGLLVVLLALQRDAEIDLPAPQAPDWGPLPTRSDLAHTEFPLRVPGYDPASVDLAFDALADSYADLLAEADRATIARARRRAELRLGRDDDDRRAAPADGLGTALEAADPSSEPAAAAGLGPPTAAELTRDALRTEVALDALRRDGEEVG
jgi:hypothetical protein